MKHTASSVIIVYVSSANDMVWVMHIRKSRNIVMMKEKKM